MNRPEFIEDKEDTLQENNEIPIDFDNLVKINFLID